MPQAEMTRELEIGKPDKELLLSMNEVMQRLKIGRTVLRQLINEDLDFVTIKLGERRLMSVSALESFVAGKEREARGERQPAA